MEHADHVNLLRRGIPGPGGIWADFGSGSGAFTLALADLIQPTGTIYSIDRDGSALQAQEKQMKLRFPEVKVYYQKANYAYPLQLPPLDGIIAANTLHFLQDKEPVLAPVLRLSETRRADDPGRIQHRGRKLCCTLSSPVSSMGAISETVRLFVTPGFSPPVPAASCERSTRP